MEEADSHPFYRFLASLVSFLSSCVAAPVDFYGEVEFVADRTKREGVRRATHSLSYYNDVNRRSVALSRRQVLFVEDRRLLVELLLMAFDNGSKFADFT